MYSISCLLALKILFIHFYEYVFQKYSNKNALLLKNILIVSAHVLVNFSDFQIETYFPLEFNTLVTCLQFSVLSFRSMMTFESIC